VRAAIPLLRYLYISDFFVVNGENAAGATASRRGCRRSDAVAGPPDVITSAIMPGTNAKSSPIRHRRACFRPLNFSGGSTHRLRSMWSAATDKNLRHQCARPYFMGPQVIIRSF